MRPLSSKERGNLLQASTRTFANIAILEAVLFRFPVDARIISLSRLLWQRSMREANYYLSPPRFLCSMPAPAIRYFLRLSDKRDRGFRSLASEKPT